MVIYLLHYLPTLKGKIRKITKIKYKQKKYQETKKANYFEKQKQKEKKP